MNGSAMANSVGMLAKFSKEGMGIALLPDFLAFHPGFGDGLVRVLSEWEGTPAHLFAVTPSELQPERVRKLASFLQGELRSRGKQHNRDRLASRTASRIGPTPALHRANYGSLVSMND